MESWNHGIMETVMVCGNSANALRAFNSEAALTGRALHPQGGWHQTAHSPAGNDALKNLLWPPLAAPVLIGTSAALTTTLPWQLHQMLRRLQHIIRQS
jgi:hypothetical protein